MVPEYELKLKGLQRPHSQRSVIVGSDQLWVVVDDELVDATWAALVIDQRLDQGALVDRVDVNDAIVSRSNYQAVLEFRKLSFKVSKSKAIKIGGHLPLS